MPPERRSGGHEEVASPLHAAVHRSEWPLLREVPRASLHIVHHGSRVRGGHEDPHGKGFCSEGEWKRAYREINDFERQLVDFGTILFKFWLHIDKEEQLRRFESRSDDKLRSWKLTDEDWRNREKWNQYEEAVNEMLLKTSTMTAPWTVVEGNSKLYARIKILKTLVDKLSHELQYDPYRALGLPSDDKGKEKKKKKK